MQKIWLAQNYDINKNPQQRYETLLKNIRMIKDTNGASINYVYKQGGGVLAKS